MHFQTCQEAHDIFLLKILSTLYSTFIPYTHMHNGRSRFCLKIRTLPLFILLLLMQKISAAILRDDKNPHTCTVAYSFVSPQSFYSFFFSVFIHFSFSSTSSCSTAEKPWDSGCSTEGHGLEVTWGGEDLGCMRTRCLSFHETGKKGPIERERERKAEKWREAVLNYPDQWQGWGWGA